MKNLLLTVVCLLSLVTKAQTIWDAEFITFSKENNADWTLEENQDRITDNVWITRADDGSIFNIVLEAEDDEDFFESPFDTRWAFGTTAEIDDLTFNFFDVAIMSFPPNLIDQDMVMYLVTDDIYVDVKFSFYQEGPEAGEEGGGGFAYTRASQPILSAEENSKPVVSIFPNPTSTFLEVSGILENKAYTITSVSGQLLKKGFIENDSRLNIADLASGVYLLALENHTFYRFIKK